MFTSPYYIRVCICVTTFICATQAAATTIYYKSEDLERKEGLCLYAPLDASPEGIKDFLQHVYNRRDYSNVLAHNMNHLIQLLQHGKDTTQNKAYAQSVIKLFHNKCKSVESINAYVFSLTLSQLPELLEHHFTTNRTQDLKRYKECVNSILYTTFLSKYDNFKKDPQAFFDTLSDEILESISNDTLAIPEDITAQELRHTVMRFLELSLAKLAWSPDEYSKIWDCVKAISQQLEHLMLANIIDNENDLDDLFWSLIHRFCYFIELASPDLPEEFYERIKNDIGQQGLLMLEMDEQEEFIETKASYLLQTILEDLAKKQALAAGIVIRK